MTVFVAAHSPAYFDRIWASIFVQAHAVGQAIANGDIVAVLAGLLSNLFLVLSPVGLALIYVLLCRRLGVALALTRERRAVVTR
jgi:hypothetical protein